VSGIGRLRPSSPRAGLRLWLRPELEEAWREGLPLEGEQLKSSGRGGLLRVDTALGPALLRTYRRGGLLRRVLPDVFPSPDRALRELAAAERLEPLGLAPAVLGLELRGRGLLRLRVAVAEIPGGRDLLRLAADQSPALQLPVLGRAVGEAVAAMHAAGVSHPDLNAANVLVADDGVSLLDFDGATLHEGEVPPAQRRREVLRLCRSLDKWAVTINTPAAVRAAFLRAALPRGQRLAAFAAGRRQHARRSAAGKVGLPLPSSSSPPPSE